MSLLSDYWPYLTVAAIAVFFAFIILLLPRVRKKEKDPLEPKLEDKERWPLTVKHSITTIEVKRSRDELRLLELEREIVSYAIRRLYEAEAEGKISEGERNRLASEYRDRMTRIKDTISRSGSIVALHELETMQNDFLKSFSEHFSNLNQKIEDLRSRLEIKQVEEVPASLLSHQPTAAPKPGKEEPSLPPTTQKTEVEERIDKIRAEIEKVLERLEQIETEE